MRNILFIPLIILILAACSKQPKRDTPTNAPAASATQEDQHVRSQALKYKNPREGVKFQSFNGGAADLKKANKEASQ